MAVDVQQTTCQPQAMHLPCSTDAPGANAPAAVKTIARDDTWACWAPSKPCLLFVSTSTFKVAFQVACADTAGSKRRALSSCAARAPFCVDSRALSSPYWSTNVSPVLIYKNA